MSHRPSVMWQYIAEEPEILGRLLCEYQEGMSTVEALKPWKAIYIVAHGSSFNAGVAIASFFSRLTGLRVQPLTPAEFVWWPSTWQNESAEDLLMVAISQTGTSSGVLEAAARAKKSGCTVLGITNEADSALTKMADLVLNLGCGIEDSNAKTKGYSATLLTLMLLAMRIGRNSDVLSEAESTTIEAELAAQIKAICATGQKVREWCGQNQFEKDCTHLVFLGSSMNYGSALEGQLKLVETLTVPAIACNIQEFSHGVHRSVNPNTHIVLFAADLNFRDLIFETFLYLQTITPHILLLDASDRGLEHPNIIHIPHFEKTESILLQTIAVQVLGVALPEWNGLDPNRPANDRYVTIARTRISTT